MKTAVIPRGWLREFLKTQKSGLTGHMEKAGYPYNERYWGAKKYPEFKGVFWWPFEQTAYHIDGMTRTAILLQDKELLKKRKILFIRSLKIPMRTAISVRKSSKKSPMTLSDGLMSFFSVLVSRFMNIIMMKTS